MTESKIQPPLGGYRALDLTQYLGFTCGKVLADLGVDVIKIEPPFGDTTRNNGPFVRDEMHPEGSLTWLAGNTNKRGVTLNLEVASGQELFRRLAMRADFVLESFSPGYLDGLGLGYHRLKEVNPRLVMTSITPFGQSGPESQYAAGDLQIMAASGCMHLVGDPNREPLRVSEPQSADWTGVHAAAGTLIAHYHRELTGVGQHVDVSAQATMLWATVHAPIAWDVNREMHTRAGSQLVGRSVIGTRFHTIWPCKDGYITFTLYGGPPGKRTNKQLTEWMDHYGLAAAWMKSYDWDHFDVNTVTQPEVDRIEAAIRPFFLHLTKAEFLKGVVERDMLGYPVSSVDDLLVDPQLQARGFWQRLEHPALGITLPYPGPFAKFSAMQFVPPRPAPRIGEHNIEIYERELGLKPVELECLKAAGVI